MYFLSVPNVSQSLVNPGLPATSCTSDPFPPEDLPLDLNAEFLLEAGVVFDTRGVYYLPFFCLAVSFEYIFAHFFKDVFALKSSTIIF